MLLTEILIFVLFYKKVEDFFCGLLEVGICFIIFLTMVVYKEKSILFRTSGCVKVQPHTNINDIYQDFIIWKNLIEEFFWMVLDRVEPFSLIVMDGHQYIYVCIENQSLHYIILCIKNQKIMYKKSN